MKYFGHAQTCLTTSTRKDNINLVPLWMSICMQQIKQIHHFLLMILLIPYFEVLWACQTCLPKPTWKDWINMLPLDLSTHVEKSTLYNTSFLRYCWFIILKYLGMPRCLWPHPLERTQSIWCLYGCLPICKKSTSYINFSWDIWVSRILESDWSRAFWVITPKIIKELPQNLLNSCKASQQRCYERWNENHWGLLHS